MAGTVPSVHLIFGVFGLAQAVGKVPERVFYTSIVCVIDV